MSLSLARIIGNDGVVPADAASLKVAGITSDSREVRPGDLFVAIPGGTTDGATYISDARARGAIAVAGLGRLGLGRLCRLAGH